MRPRSLVASLALAPVALVIGCGIEDPPKFDIASTEQALSDPLFEMPLNGYPPEGLDVNYALLSTIWQHPLNTMGVGDTLNTVALTQEGTPILTRDGTPARISSLFNTGSPTSAEHLMDEIVSCAFAWGHDVSYLVGNTRLVSKGQFGLCDAGSPVNSWQTTAASPQCRFMASACILARMNALHKHVPISIRVPGELARDVPGFRPVSKVRVQPMLRNGYLAAHDWQPDFVGICTRGTTVTLQRTAATGRPVRVCTGIHACEPPPAPPDLIITSSTRVYSGFLDTSDDGVTISFKCPTNAATAPNGKPDRAYFSILTKPPSLGGLPSSDLMLAPISDLTTTYPAVEQEVFTYVEGAFYGNILPDPRSGLDRNACYSAVWKEGTMYETGRACADPEDSGHCSTRSGPCDHDSGGRDATGGQAFYGFTSVWWWYGVTVFLNDPNAILYDPNAIPNHPIALDTILKATAIQSVHDVCTPGTSLANDKPGGVVATVCGSDPYCCSVAWDRICVDKARANSPECGTGIVSCSHSVCTTGAQLANGCSPVVTSVCAADPFCCNTAWDTTCVQEVQTVAHNPPCPCSHPVCTTGAALISGCSPVVTSVCAVDPFCCNTAWDGLCVDEVRTIAHTACP